MESPRYYMQLGTPLRNPARAYEILLRARQTQLQALRELYLLHKSVELDAYQVSKNGTEIRLRGLERSAGIAPRPVQSRDRVHTTLSLEDKVLTSEKDGLTYANVLTSGLHRSINQYRDLFTKPKLKNAMLSTCVVALAQQLCGINVFAFYSRAVNFVFGLLAIRRIDTWGRRKLMLTTLPLMSLFLAAAALVFIHDYWKTHIPALVVFIYLFSAVYSPSLGPIPFTLASESFPLAQREAGCSVAIAVNLFFAGVLTVCYPELDHATKSWGGLALFSGLNLVAFVLVFFLVEETKGFELEELNAIFAVPKRTFIRHQLKYLRYLWLTRFEKK
ncbi:hypothetical protein N0V93_005914 [Gnomoniopsis smithogilvyi]|uniref:Major facilitator superfamily (MFS) profile domain-containing protein n=1 Tax=Gnomoniopsis smithogilvyi TaxID=1191159 RepID=A0A9W8YU67_9PEZI|nr:hypothetical protein N0V93_005914 [Gnomoniopsis smithogilvyi]